MSRLVCHYQTGIKKNREARSEAEFAESNRTALQKVDKNTKTEE